MRHLIPVYFSLVFALALSSGAAAAPGAAAAGDDADVEVSSAPPSKTLGGKTPPAKASVEASTAPLPGKWTSGKPVVEKSSAPLGVGWVDGKPAVAASTTSLTEFADDVAACRKSQTPSTILKKASAEVLAAEKSGGPVTDEAVRGDFAAMLRIAHYYECMAMAEDTEAQCQSIPAKHPRIGFDEKEPVFDDSVRKACIQNVRKFSFLKAVHSGSHADIVASLKRSAAGKPGADREPMDAFADLLLHIRKTGSAAGVQLPPGIEEADYQFALGKAACASLGDERQKADCESNAVILAALKDGSPARCDRPQQPLCGGMIAGAEYCEAFKTKTINEYCANLTNQPTPPSMNPVKLKAK